MRRAGAFSIYRASSEGDLTGLPALKPGRNLRVKPFVLGGSVRSVGEDHFDGDFTGGADDNPTDYYYGGNGTGVIISSRPIITRFTSAGTENFRGR